MGVPKFYRWLSERYPLINQLISDETLLPEFDNLYLDMNGILHNCSHPNDDVASQLSDRDIMLGIFAYIDRIVTQIVRPQKVLFLAVDGCAPRAKLNQQRSRRFRSAKDAKEQKLEMRQRGEEVNDEDVFDSNCITPGTEWMAKVSEHLKYFIRKKLKEDPSWQRLTVVYSGMDVPGEGEHKIMSYIRHQRAKGVFHPNTRHCMYGQDADLVMLGLITHEPHFTLLREVIDFGAFRRRGGGPKMRQTEKAQFQLLHLSVLRQYLHLEFTRDMPPTRTYDSERLIDDFVFLTFLVGNDFLPHMPSLDIGEHAFDKLFNIYREMLVKWGSEYLTENGKVPNPDRLEELLVAIGDLEDEIFEERAAEVQSFNQRRRERDMRFGGSSGPSQEEEEQEKSRIQAEVYSKLVEAMGPDVPSPNEIDFKTHYYMEKLGISPKHEFFHDQLRQAYIEGLLWCLAYYYQGCVSWGWFYPYHYGPLISDLTDLRIRFARINFTLGQPFLPYFQLLGCLPPASGQFLPRPYRWLMTDPQSPIIDFYPEDFKVDMNGKRNPWEAVNLLPFIDEQRMKEAVAQYCSENTLSLEERRRNEFGQIHLYYFDRTNITTIRSCNPEIGLPDILQCHSSVVNLDVEAFDDVGDEVRTSALREGVTIPLPGFPSLETLPRRKVEVKAISLNCFGSGSRYQSMILDLLLPESIPSAADVAASIAGRSVFVNWPNLHEAKVVGVKDRTLTANIEEDRSTGQPYITSLENDVDVAEKYDFLADDERRRYLSGREIPGTGGLDLGPVTTQLVVRPLQGMRRDPRTGATSKVFGNQEATIPYQLVLFENPCPDPRFEEQAEQSLEQRAPVGAKVLYLKGRWKGLNGVIKSHNKNGSVNIITEMRDPEPPFGLSIARSVNEQYVDSSRLARSLRIRPDVLGKIVGSVRIEPGRIDIGLNLKWNGRYQTMGYSKCYLNKQPAWATGDAVKVVGSEQIDEHFLTGDWKFSRKAGEILVEYMQRFPMVFHNLTSIGHAKHYNAKQLLGQEHETKLRELQQWLKQLPTATLPRTPLTTLALSAEAVRAVQRAADVRTAHAANQEKQGRVINGIFPDYFEVAGSMLVTDVPIDRTPTTRPELGVRVCSLTFPGVPFGLWGTVVAIHPHSACVEVLFDEEFMGGTSLNGLCANHRGKLLPWSSLVVVSAVLPPHSQQQSQSGKGSLQNNGKPRAQKQALQAHTAPPKRAPQGNQKGYRNISVAGKKAENQAVAARNILTKSLGIQQKQANQQKGQSLKPKPKPKNQSRQNPQKQGPQMNSPQRTAGQHKISSGAESPRKNLPSHSEINALLGKWQTEMNVQCKDLPAHHQSRSHSGPSLVNQPTVAQLEANIPYQNQPRSQQKNIQHQSGQLPMHPQTVEQLEANLPQRNQQPMQSSRNPQQQQMFMMQQQQQQQQQQHIQGYVNYNNNQAMQMPMGGPMPPSNQQYFQPQNPYMMQQQNQQMMQPHYQQQYATQGYPQNNRTVVHNIRHEQQYPPNDQYQGSSGGYAQGSQMGYQVQNYEGNQIHTPPRHRGKGYSSGPTTLMPSQVFKHQNQRKKG